MSITATVWLAVVAVCVAAPLSRVELHVADAKYELRFDASDATRFEAIAGEFAGSLGFTDPAFRQVRGDATAGPYFLVVYT